MASVPMGMWMIASNSQSTFHFQFMQNHAFFFRFQFECRIMQIMRAVILRILEILLKSLIMQHSVHHLAQILQGHVELCNSVLYTFSIFSTLIFAIPFFFCG